MSDKPALTLRIGRRRCTCKSSVRASSCPNASLKRCKLRSGQLRRIAFSALLGTLHRVISDTATMLRSRARSNKRSCNPSTAPRPAIGTNASQLLLLCFCLWPCCAPFAQAIAFQANLFWCEGSVSWTCVLIAYCCVFTRDACCSSVLAHLGH